MTEDLLTTYAAAKLLKVSRQTLAIWRLRGVGCRYIKLGSRVLYSPSDVAAWLESNTRACTSEAGGAGTPT